MQKDTSLRGSSVQYVGEYTEPQTNETKLENRPELFYFRISGEGICQKGQNRKWLRILLWRSFCNFSNVLNRRPMELDLAEEYSEKIADRLETRYKTEDNLFWPADGSLL